MACKVSVESNTYRYYPGNLLIEPIIPMSLQVPFTGVVEASFVISLPCLRSPRSVCSYRYCWRHLAGLHTSRPQSRRISSTLLLTAHPFHATTKVTGVLAGSTSGTRPPSPLVRRCATLTQAAVCALIGALQSRNRRICGNLIAG